MNILLLGFMGSGKSSLGKRLAGKMNFKFVDLDKEIEEEEGLPIPVIFSEKGEAAFRLMEKKWLQRFKGDQTVISLGGGTPCFEDNMDRIRQIGTTVYLKMPPGALADRLLHSKNPRPLITKFKDNPKDLLTYVSSKLNEREPYYNQAQIILDAMDIGNEKLELLVEAVKLGNQD